MGRLAPSPPSASGAPAPRQRRRWPGVLALVAVLLVAVWTALGFWNVNYYVITPGNATPVAPFISVPPHLSHPLTGTILLTDVFVEPLTRARTW